MTREAFLAWVDEQPSGKFVHFDGIVVAMARERISHIRRKSAALNALRRAIGEVGRASCEALGDGVTVQVDDSDFEPDALMYCGPRLPGNSTKVPAPCLLVEVLSPDSGTRHRATKLRAYFKLPSVRHYLLGWPDEQRLVHHARLPNDQIATQVFTSGDINLDPPGITVTVEEFYVD
jgi:Uma2 family endonuclease